MGICLGKAAGHVMPHARDAQDCALSWHGPGPRHCLGGRAMQKKPPQRSHQARTIVVDFHAEATYGTLLGQGKAFIDVVVAFILSIGWLVRVGLAYSAVRDPALVDESGPGELQA
jgi:hypothetical protein